MWFKMVYHETAYIRHYTRNNKKENRQIKTVEVRGIKASSKFKDNEKIILISQKEFNQMQESHEHELNQLRQENKELKEQLNNNEHGTHHETNQLYIKLIALMEMINNRNELLLNANDNLNNAIDLIIKDITSQYNNLINDNNKEIKNNLETFLKSLFDNANDNQILLKNEISRIETELNEANEQLNNLSLLELIRKRKQININIDLSNLKALENNLINYSELNLNVASNNIIVKPDFNELDLIRVKESHKNKIDFQQLYINLDHEQE